MNDVPNVLQQLLVEHGQEHVLKFWDELGESQREHLVHQLETVDFDSLQCNLEPSKKGKVQPSPVISLDNQYREEGIQSITKGELGVLTVAGGQGTRLGWSGPKGTFPATPVTGKSLFQLVAEQILFASNKYGVSIPWYIMTSNQNDAVTRSFLLDNNCFGLDRTDIFIFTQGEVPSVDENGKMLLASKGCVAMSPDGHGGVIGALKRSGGLDEMDAKGIRHLSYVQIDNPLANVVDPAFLGIHLSENSSKEVTSKCVRKISADERVGVFCLVDGNTTIVEYSDLPLEKSTEKDKTDRLVYWAGSIALHLISTDFLQRVADNLPWHIANKKVPFVDIDTGAIVEPNKPNAYKFERFVFDIMPLASASLVVETNRQEEFAPIKNAEGEDSPSTSHALQQARAKRWLQERGVVVSENAIVELNPLTAASSEDLDQVELPTSIDSNSMVVI